MVVRSSLLDQVPRDVLVTDPRTICTLAQLTSEAGWMEREAAEIDLAWRQPIPYVLMSIRERVTNQPPVRHVLMQRMKGQGEKRLLGKLYLGAGGHVEEGHTLGYTALKEVTEELGLPISLIELKGVIITTGGPVEDVHVAAFYHAWSNYSQFNSPEVDLHNATWTDEEEMAAHYPHMEKWSQIVARDYLKLKV